MFVSDDEVNLSIVLRWLNEQPLACRILGRCLVLIVAHILVSNANVASLYFPSLVSPICPDPYHDPFVITLHDNLIYLD